MNNLMQIQEENDAWFARGDRFDGFDRGDSAKAYADEQDAKNEQWEAEYVEWVAQQQVKA